MLFLCLDFQNRSDGVDFLRESNGEGIRRLTERDFAVAEEFDGGDALGGETLDGELHVVGPCECCGIEDVSFLRESDFR